VCLTRSFRLRSICGTNSCHERPPFDRSSTRIARFYHVVFFGFIGGDGLLKTWRTPKVLQDLRCALVGREHGIEDMLDLAAEHD